LAADLADRPALPAGYRLVAYGSVGSTNEEACRLACEGAADGTTVWALRQTAGRGRRGRGWESPEGNLYFSLILRPARPAAETAQLTFVTAVALGETVCELLPGTADLRYKWPNDILLGGRKVAGILLESAGAARGAVDWVVIGVGLNVARFPATTDGYPATSLSAAGAAAVAPADVLQRFVARFAGRYQGWLSGGIGPVREEWLARAARIGEDIEVRLPDRSLRGRFIGLDPGGALILGLPDGSRSTVAAGDVFF